MSPETILIKRVKTQNGLSTTKRILVDDISGTGNISNMDNIRDILITKINIKKERKIMSINDIKTELEKGTKTPEELAAMIIAYLSEMTAEADTKLGSEIDKESIMLKSIITEIKKSTVLSEDYKKRCINNLLGDLEELEGQLEEINTAYENLEEEISEHNIKTNRKKRIVKILTITATVVAVAATAVLAFKIYRKYSPSPIELDMNLDDVVGSDMLS